MEADLKTFHQHGVYGMAIPTLLTVQNTMGIRKVKILEPDFLEEQMEFLLEDIFPDVIKIGALGSRQIIQTLTRLLSQSRFDGVKIIIDTVLLSTSGAALFDMRALPDFLERLLPRAFLITPNISEFELISGKGINENNASKHLRDFAKDKPYAVLLKGGHFPGNPIDYLYADGQVKIFPSTRIETPHTHGTGCVLASAIAAHLAKGEELTNAVKLARDFVHQAILTNPGIGKGHGPLNLLHQ